MTELLLAILIGLKQPQPQRIIPLETPQNAPVSILEEVWGDIAPEAEKIIWCESRGKLDAWNKQSDARGLFQIHYPTWNKVFPGSDFFDERINHQIARYIYNQTNDWRQWSCRKSIYSNN